MKKNIKIIVSSAALIAGTVGASIGATLALFTSDATSQVSVKTGKVNVAMNIENLKTYSGEWNETSSSYDLVETEVAGVFTNGGTANVNEGVLTVDRITPMDKVEFDVTFENKSNIEIQYRTTKEILADSGLFEALEVKFDEEVYDGLTSYSEWKKLEANGAITGYHVSLLMPEEAGNEYQEKSCSLKFGIDAVQGNAHVEGTPEGADICLYTPSDLMIYGKGVEANSPKYTHKTAVLMRDIDMEESIWSPINAAGRHLTFDGNGKTIKNFTITSGLHNSGFFSAAGDGLTVKNVTFDNVHVEAVGRVGIVVGHAMCARVENVKVINSSVKAVVTNNDDGDKAGAIVGYLSAEPVAYVKNCTVENCVVEGYRDIGSLVGYAGGKSAFEVSGNTVKDSKVINDQRVNYKNYTNPADFDAHELIGEQAIAGICENNTITNVQLNYLLEQKVLTSETGLEDMSLSAGSVATPEGNKPLVTVEIPTSSGKIKAGEDDISEEDTLTLKVEEKDTSDTTIVLQEDEKSLNFEISLQNQDGKKVNSVETPIYVKIYVGDKIIKKVYHAGVELIKDVDYTYEDGIITIKTSSFSPFDVVFEDYLSDAELLAKYPNASCRIDNVGYDNPFGINTVIGKKNAALFNVKSGQTIKMVKDFITSEPQNVPNHLDNDSVVTIDLNGKTIDYKKNIELHFGTYVIDDSSVNKDGKINGINLSNFQSSMTGKDYVSVVVNAGHVHQINHSIDKGTKHIVVKGGTVDLIQVYCDIKQATAEIYDSGMVGYFIAENGYNIDANLTLYGCAKNLMADQDKRDACQNFFGSTTYTSYNWYTISK